MFALVGFQGAVPVCCRFDGFGAYAEDDVVFAEAGCLGFAVFRDLFYQQAGGDAEVVRHLMRERLDYCAYLELAAEERDVEAAAGGYVSAACAGEKAEALGRVAAAGVFAGVELVPDVALHGVVVDELEGDGLLIAFANDDEADPAAGKQLVEGVVELGGVYDVLAVDGEHHIIEAEAFLAACRGIVINEGDDRAALFCEAQPGEGLVVDIGNVDAEIAGDGGVRGHVQMIEDFVDGLILRVEAYGRECRGCCEQRNGGYG